MKRPILWAATAGIALAGCTHVECPGIESAQTAEEVQSEITITPFNRKMSRGIVEGTDFKQGSESRHMYISAYNATEGTDYFINETFGEKTDGGGNGTGVWGAVTPTGNEDNPWLPEPIYWPFGAKLDFLAYSQSYDLEELYDYDLEPTPAVVDPTPAVVDPTPAVVDPEHATKSRAAYEPIRYPAPKIFANWKSANEVELEVTQDSKQDDILYAAASGLNSSNSNSGIGFSMTFNHAQAWLTFMLRLTEGSGGGDLTINSIKCANIYSGGWLTLKNEGDGNASANWHFFPLAPSDVTVTPEYYRNYVFNYQKDLDILLPPQDHDGFIINYTLNGIESNLRITRDQLKSSSGTWKAGTHYTYHFSFTVNEITVAPYVTAWESKSDEWEETHEYVEKMENVLKYVSTTYASAYNHMFDPYRADGAHFYLHLKNFSNMISKTYICFDLLFDLLHDYKQTESNVSIEPAGTTVSKISYKEKDWDWNGNGFINSTMHSDDALANAGLNTENLGEYIWYTLICEDSSPDIVLVLDNEQTIELHLTFSKLMILKMRIGSFGGKFGLTGFPYYEHGMRITTGTNSFEIPSGMSESRFKEIIKAFFSHLHSSNTIIGNNFTLNTVTYNSENYAWDDGEQSFKKDDSSKLEATLWSAFNSLATGNSVSITLPCGEEDNVDLMIKKIDFTLTP